MVKQRIRIAKKFKRRTSSKLRQESGAEDDPPPKPDLDTPERDYRIEHQKTSYFQDYNINRLDYHLETPEEKALSIEEWLDEEDPFEDRNSIDYVFDIAFQETDEYKEQTRRFYKGKI